MKRWEKEQAKVDRINKQLQTIVDLPAVTSKLSKFEPILDEEPARPVEVREFRDLKSRKDFLEHALPVFVCVPCKRMFIKRKTLNCH